MAMVDVTEKPVIRRQAEAAGNRCHVPFRHFDSGAIPGLSPGGDCMDGSLLAISLFTSE